MEIETSESLFSHKEGSLPERTSVFTIKNFKQRRVWNGMGYLKQSCFSARMLRQRLDVRSLGQLRKDLGTGQGWNGCSLRTSPTEILSLWTFMWIWWAQTQRRVMKKCSSSSGPSPKWITIPFLIFMPITALLLKWMNKIPYLKPNFVCGLGWFTSHGSGTRIGWVSTQRSRGVFLSSMKWPGPL